MKLMCVCVCVCVCVHVLSHVSLYDPMDCSPPDSFAHGVFQARVLEWIAISFSRGFFQPSNQAGISCIGRLILLPLSDQGSPALSFPIITNQGVS